jgi:hypothetical protein
MSADQRSSVGLSICISFCCLLAYSLNLTALVIAYNNSDVDCISDYAGISFSYITWLKVFGFIGTAYMFILLFLISVFTYNQADTITIIQIIKLSYIPYFMFNFVWYIVGAVLYFETVHSCNSSLPIRSFGLALFIIQTIGMCSINSSRSDESSTNSNIV